MTIRGHDLAPLDWTSKTSSAQIKSAILLAGLVSQVAVRVTEPVKSRDHTENMLAGLGADIIVDGNTVTLPIVHSLRRSISTSPLIRRRPLSLRRWPRSLDVASFG